MTTKREALARYVAPPLTRERLDRQWDAIDERATPRAWTRSRAPLAAAFAFAACAAIALVVVLLRGPTTAMTLVDGTWLESPSTGTPPDVTLADGSRVALGASSRVRLTRTRADAVRLDLERGRVDIRATHVKGRSFSVVARGIEVRVVGTRFSVQADDRVRVRVDEGRVIVKDATGEHAVSAHEEWAEEPPVVHDVPPVSPLPSSTTGQVDEDVTPDAGPAREGRSAAPASGKELLDGAQRALAQGRIREAARMFDAIRREHRSDPRAGLAAFELGRLRLDKLGDPAGADEAFVDALRLSRDPGLRDDAEARRVEALDRTGAHEACVRARQAYLNGRPKGIHRTEVGGRCDEP
jgi:transmembrane sensor